MKQKKVLLAIVLSFVMAAVFTPQKAYAASPYITVDTEPSKVGKYYFKLNYDDYSRYNLYRSKYKNKGYKRIAKNVLDIWEHKVCAVNGKYAYVAKFTDENEAHLIRYTVSGGRKKTIKRLSKGYWILGAAKGNKLLLERGNNGDIYTYNISNNKLKKIKANYSFATISSQLGNYVLLRKSEGKKEIHSIFKITSSGKLKKTKTLGNIIFYPYNEVPCSELTIKGKKIYYVLDNKNSYSLRRCNLNGSNVETLGTFYKKDRDYQFSTYTCTSKSCEITSDDDEHRYVYKYTYATKELKLKETY